MELWRWDYEYGIMDMESWYGYGIMDMGFWIWDYVYGNTGIYGVSIWNEMVVMLMGWVWDYGHGIMDMGS